MHLNVIYILILLFVFVISNNYNRIKKTTKKLTILKIDEDIFTLCTCILSAYYFFIYKLYTYYICPYGPI